VYSEYFASGTEPTEYCDLHGSRGFFGTLASIFHSEPPPPPHAVDQKPPAPVVADAAAPPPSAPAAAEEPAKEKRGFWGKLFGRKK
jgi:hypothetical protein